MPFTHLGLSDPLLRGVLASGYTTPTEIQCEAIPAALTGQDIIGCAQTGTGKTAAFVLPILSRIFRDEPVPGQKRAIRSLILTPTRELAVQIERCIVNYGRYVGVRSLAIYGGVEIRKQLETLRRGVDIVVATPGRLMDHMRRGSIDFKAVEVLVLDEADRMFDMGFIDDVYRIIRTLPEQRQTLLFSATMPPEVRQLAAGVQKNPQTIQIGRQHNPIETITQHVHAVLRQQKIDLLLHMLQNRPMQSVLVFSRTKHGADKIHRKLEQAGIVSVALHSGRSQAQRQHALDGFKKGKYQVMVATDIAARGIDVRGISHVVNFDVPLYARDYIHRIGRTGRAFHEGDAITLVAPDEQEYLRKIEQFIGQRFRPEEYEGFTSAHLTESLSRSEEQTRSQRLAARARKAARRPRLTRRRSRLAAAR
ncbi:MAG: DEAD/DEAH box helicase [Planctomycetes bacterium]|nr:DEAD/DEAH box helicase [Planctomycetota bacterium]